MLDQLAAAIPCPRSRLLQAAVAFVVLATLAVSSAETAAGGTVPDRFEDDVALSGLTQPMAVRFSPDGRVFVAEKSGLIKVFDDPGDPTPTVFADLRTNVHNFWDRGLMGLALDPNFPATPYVYVLYAYDRDPAVPGTVPRWGTPGATSDPCPNPPGATDDGCVISGRLSRLQASGDQMTGAEQELLTGWCQQYPSHSVGSLAFGQDGALYVSGGEGASFTFVDQGQDGNPPNPCGDPPSGAGGLQISPTAEGGATRSQDLRTASDPTGLSGSILRVDPSTGVALPSNPGTGDANARRIVAHGFRNPFRFTVRPGTNELWVGDVGWSTWEEIDRIADPGASPVENLGWPCYEGGEQGGSALSVRQPGYDGRNLNICENLYADNEDGTPAVETPYYSYPHSAAVVGGESCPTGSSSISGMAFYEGGDYPSQYDGALFFADYSRNCIWVMPPGANGLPSRANRATFDAGAAAPVDLQIGPGGDLFYADFNGGTIHRVRYFPENQPPTAVATASPTQGPAPLQVDFDGTGSSDPNPGDTLDYAWDLDGDGQFDDSTDPQPSRTYAEGTYTVRLQITDDQGMSDTSAPIAISASDGPPTVTIDTPDPGTTWTAGQEISFSGHATDPQDGPLGSSDLSWSLTLQHCPSNCHPHSLESFPGIDHGSFDAPDHEYPSHLELALTATDSGGLTDTQTLRLDPEVVDLTFDSSPAGTAELTADSTAEPTPFTRTVIVGSRHSLSAPATVPGIPPYWFDSWSDGGGRAHDIVSPATATTYTASFQADRPPSAIATVDPSEGDAPLTASFDATGSSDPDPPDTLHYSWDLDDDGHFDDSTSARPTGTYGAGAHTVRLRATDSFSLTDTDSVTINALERRARKVVRLRFKSRPIHGVRLIVAGERERTPFRRSEAVGSSVDVKAPRRARRSGKVFRFVRWTDEGARAHHVVAKSEPTRYVAVYRRIK